MSENSKIYESLNGIFNTFGGKGNTDVFTAVVKGVDKPSRTCSITGISDKAGVNYDGVLLMAVVDDGILYIPKKDSYVLVGNNARQQPFVMMFSELDEIIYIVGNSIIDILPSLIKMNNGENFGLVNVKPLVDKINALENTINNLKTAVAAVVIAGTVADGGAVKAGILTGLGSGIMPITKQSDLEDTKITH